ncbi:L-threonylcarbamoyladenylate synthase [Halalkalicoccus subterraneus]|uniref:L-threonylcarbamoyladenylate synthase n=1 Tax=Halalkalicoccus subterraneus TaxID=2675002 RepID=UPI000EFCFF1A|nr:L-threonylcarbamoyladenylate synthase [Halalkalicoccus subterraneus]
MEIDRAVRAIHDGGLVVYPTETVYGLGADALDPAAVERVYEAKGRNRSKPLSMAVPEVESAAQYTHLTERERRFIEEFLPGPVTAIVAAGPDVPEELTAGRDRVGIRIPDHELALALLDEAAPITATSANVSGRPSVRRADALDPEIREAATQVLDGGETGGTESTVVDVERGVIHRRGTLAEEIEGWLEAQ